MVRIVNKYRIRFFNDIIKIRISSYRPQRSCGKVMFSQACVKNSVRGGCVSQHALEQTPHPVMLRYTPPCPVHPGMHNPQGRHPPPPARFAGVIILAGTETS